jgi:WD40 repeat protein
MPLPFSIGDSHFSPDGRILALSHNAGIVFWDVDKNRQRLEIAPPRPFQMSRIAFAPDSKMLAGITERYGVGGALSCTLRLWEVATGKEVLQVPMDDRVSAVAFAPDGKRVACGGDEAIQILDASSGKTLLQYRGSGARIHCLAFSPDGKQLASGLGDSTTLVWDASR